MSVSEVSDMFVSLTDVRKRTLSCARRQPCLLSMAIASIARCKKSSSITLPRYKTQPTYYSNKGRSSNQPALFTDDQTVQTCFETNLHLQMKIFANND